MRPRNGGKFSQIAEEKLGPAEAFFYRVHEAFSGGSAILCVSARIAGPLDIQLVKQSCRRLWERHPLLRARISTRQDGPYFILDVPFNRIPVHSVFELGKTDIRTFVEREISSAFEKDRPLWKVLLVTDKVKLDKHYLIVCTHRSISDPFCTVSLVREILAGCVNILSGTAAEGGLLPLCPNFEHITASIPGPLFPGGAPGRKDGDEPAGRVPCPPVPVHKRYTRIRSHTVEPARLKELKALCSAEKATMRGAIAAATVEALQKQLQDGFSVEIETPLTVRKLGGFTIGEDEMRSLAYDARIRSRGIADRAGFWKFARDYETALLTAALPGDWPGDDPETVGSPGLPVSCSLVYMDEIGRIPKSPFVIENFLLVRGLRSADKLMFISAMPVKDSMPITFAYVSPMLEEAWVDRFTKNFVQIIEKAVK
jgi:hypothetical protein